MLNQFILRFEYVSGYRLRKAKNPFIFILIRPRPALGRGLCLCYDYITRRSIILYYFTLTMHDKVVSLTFTVTVVLPLATALTLPFASTVATLVSPLE